MSTLTPEALLEIHKGYADEFTSLASSGLLAAFAQLANSGMFDYTPTAISINMPTFGRPNTNIDTPLPPDSPEMPELGPLKNLTELPNIDPGPVPNVPSSLTNIPAYNAPAVPSTSPPTLGVSPPLMPAAPNMPAPPTYIPIGVLQLPYPNITLPEAPVITMPAFEGKRPADITVPDPETMVSIYKAELAANRVAIPQYVRDNADILLAKYAPEYHTIRAQINSLIIGYTNPTTGGGAGIPAHIETAIMTRARGRNAEETLAALDAATSQLGKAGYSMPPLSLQGVIRDVTAKLGDANVRASTDVAIKNLEMEQKHMEFMVKLGADFEMKVLETLTNWLELALKMDQQALAVAKEILAAYLGAYNLQVMVYKALWEGYATDAAVYKTRIEAVEAQIRVYEAALKAELAKLEINKQTVEILTACVNMNKVLAETYKAQIEAAMAPLEIAKLQNQIYETQVRAYAAEVQAYEAMWKAYTAQVEGELGQYKAYTAQAEVYTAQMRGYTARVESLNAQLNAKVEYNKGIGQHNNVVLEEFSKKSDVQLKIFERNISAYDVESKVAIQQTNIELEYWRTTSNLIFQEFNVATQQVFEYAREQMNLFRGQMEAAIQAGNGLAMAANVAGNLAGGAMTGLSTFAGNLVTSQGA